MWCDILFNGKTQPTKSLAKQVEEDYTGIEEIINQAVEKNENLAMSSNPYEYVKTIHIMIAWLVRELVFYQYWKKD